MKWYEGSIAEAVAKSKTESAIFVVYVEGKDDSSQKLTKYMEEPKICTRLESKDFVCIKIDSGSETYVHFVSIYKVVPVPSLFFIGKQGTPLEIVTEIIASADELEQKMNKVLIEAGKSPATTASASLIAAEQQKTQVAAAITSDDTEKAAAATASSSQAEVTAKQAEFVCEGGVCIKKPIEETQGDEVQKQEDDNKKRDKENAERELRLKLEEKRRAKVEEEKKLEKERELQRRKDGKERQHLQAWQKENEHKLVKENIRRDRLEEQAERERIRAQIAADRAERAQRFNNENDVAATTNANTAPVMPSPPQAEITGNSTRLQFRLSTGESRTHTFENKDTLSVVRDYVKKELLPGTGIKDFILATNYPKREFLAEHETQTLLELSLYPSAVILVIGKQSNGPASIINRNGGMINMFTMIFWSILQPFINVFGYIRNLGGGGGAGNNNRRAAAGADIVGAQKRASDDLGVQQDAAKRRNLQRLAADTAVEPSTSKDSAAGRSNDGNETASKPYRRYGASNVHRLNDSHNDSDDENATWNGNSTQQQ